MRFNGAKEAVERLYALAYALVNDYERFEEPRSDPHARRLARRQPGPPGEPRGRGSKHVVRKDSTPVLPPAEARKLLDTIDTGTPAGLRARALLSPSCSTTSRG